MHSKKMLLIITACIIVDEGVPYVSIINTEERLHDYIETIKWAINLSPFVSIVFCDNSNFDFNKIKKTKDILLENASEKGKRLELLSFKGDVDKVKNRGKGYGEGEILEYVFNNSILAQGVSEYWKITGRLIVDNINEITMDKQNMFVYSPIYKNWDTRFYKLSKDAYDKCIKYAYKTVDDRNGYFLEHAYYDSTRKGKVKVNVFVNDPIVRGKSGSGGFTYAVSNDKDRIIKKIIKMFLRISVLYNTYWGRNLLTYIYQMKNERKKYEK